MREQIPIEIINIIIEMADLGIKYIYNEKLKKYESKINPTSIKYNTIDNLFVNCIFLFHSREEYTIFNRTIEYDKSEIVIISQNKKKYKKILYCSLLREIQKLNMFNMII
jgi:hypothetical protein